jgi:hypothetical protein
MNNGKRTGRWKQKNAPKYKKNFIKCVGKTGKWRGKKIDKQMGYHDKQGKA